MPNGRLESDIEWLEKSINKNEVVFTKRMLGIYKQALDDIRATLGEIYTKYESEDGKLTYAQMTQYNRLINLEKQIKNILEYANKKVINEIDKLVESQYNQSYFKAGYVLEDGLGVSIKWGRLNPNSVEYALKNKMGKISEKRLRQNSITSIQQVIASSLIRGEGYVKMTSVIKDKINGTASDALRIARTEGGRSSTAGMTALYNKAREKGVEFNLEWKTAKDDRTRPDHAILDGVEKQEKGYWVERLNIWVVEPMSSGIAEFDINCRCVEVPTGLKEERIRDEGIVEKKSFKEWANGKGLKVNRYGQAYY